MTLRVTLVQGGGAGWDQVPAVKAILQGASAEVEWEEYVAGSASLERGEAPLPPPLLESGHRTGRVLKVHLLSPQAPAGAARRSNINVEFRKALGLFASVRPLRNIAGLPARFQGLDLLVMRELTEDLYAAIEHEIIPGVVQSIKVVTETTSKRFFRFAFEWARSAGRKQVACVHKANILKQADGLFLDAFRSTARDYPEIQTRELIVDNCCMQLVSRPHQFDVLVMGNLYGDLVSDLGAGLIGGTSATLGINVGDNIRVYESLHGAHQVERNRASPLPLLLPAIELLKDSEQVQQAERIHTALVKVLEERTTLTPDLGGQATTTEMTRAIIRALGG
jgi:isocitrate dehydrogenase (NAD+)